MIKRPNFLDISAALAGICQAVELVQEVAQHGQAQPTPFHDIIHSVFQQQPEQTLEVYGGCNGISLGLKQLHKQLSKRRSQKEVDTARYLINVLYLEKKLSQDPAMLDVVGQRLSQAQEQLKHYPPTHDNVIANLAGIYSDTLSTLRFRIQVKGNPSYLQVPAHTNQIRALLLAAVRSAVLWRQVGGTRWQLLWHQRKLLAATEQLLEQC